MCSRLVIAVYGLVVSVLIAGGSEQHSAPLGEVTLIAVSPSEPYSLFAGFIHLAAGLG